MRGRRLLLAVPVPLVLATAAAAAAPGADEAVGRLYTVQWRAGAWGSTLAGDALWLAGADGALRVEVGLAGAGGPADLATRVGTGWTLCVVPDGPTLLKEWGRPWRRVAGGLGRAAGGLAAALSGRGGEGGQGPSEPEGCLAWLRSARAARDRVVRIAVPGLGAGEETGEAPVGRDGAGAAAAGPTWRQRLAVRGRGGGGPGEIWTVRLPAAGGGTGAAVVTSSRRPGRLTVSAPRASEVRYPTPEIFLPVWPLADLLAPAGAGDPAGDGP